MEQELCLVLDTLGKYRLILKKGTNYEIDEYTSKYFEDSLQIREKYKKEIENFLNDYRYLLEKSNNPNYKGRIVIVMPDKVGMDMNYYQRKVLYKKHIVAFNEFIKNKSIVMNFSLYEKRKKENSLVPDYFHHIVRLPWNNKNSVKTYINDFLRQEKKKKKDYYEIIRDMIMVYEKTIGYKTNSLSIDEIYNRYKNQKEQRLKKRLEKMNNFKLEHTNHTIVEDSLELQEKIYVVNGNKYTVDELHLIDLEDIDETSDYIPDIMRIDDWNKKI